MYRRKEKNIIIALLVLLAVAIILVVLNYLLSEYAIENVYVEGNYHYTTEEIKEKIMKGKLGNNSLYLSWKYKDGIQEEIPFVDDVTIEILSNKSIKIIVFEKALAGYIRYLDTNMYFDKDGYVVETSSVVTQGVPQITGLDFEYVVLGQALGVENPAVFENILNITKLLNKYQLPVERIHFSGNYDMTLVFGDIKVALGKDSETLEQKIMLLPKFLPELEGKSGILQMEKYDSDKGKYSFQSMNP